MLGVLEGTYPACHAQAHELGAVIYASTRDLEASLLQCDTRCTSGCMHGVVTGAFGASTPDRIVQEMNEFCSRGGMADRHRPGNCAHGVGHALMFVTRGDARVSIDRCLGFEEEGLAYYCATGVYMERFTLDSAKRALPHHDLGPCDEEPLFPGACYRYKATLLWHASGAADSVAAQCAGLDDGQRRGCYHGLGYAGITTVMRDPERIVTLCGRGDSADKAVCVEGVVEKLAELHEGRARAACAFLDADEALRNVCTQAVGRKMYAVHKPTMSLYYDREALARRRAPAGMRAEAGRRDDPHRGH
jgi:hypothetical protein